uniref:Retrotransposon gag domain-containing protein n=1 Tax=Nicotiana tabacum TaxID=4097 RepID=A0A1S4CNS8_TOBAC|nr:PREDICTED: uncharacterized protein LOC107820874 [Nicotiana tabacum]
MADKFVTAHAGAKKAKARVNHIFSIRKSPGEGLRDFLTRFNKVRMSLPNVSERMTVVAFQNGLSRNGSRATRKLLSRLMKYPPTTWKEIHNAYCAKVRADEDNLNSPTQRLTSVQVESRKDRRNNGRRDQSGPRLNQERHQPYVRTVVPPSPRHTEGPPRPLTGTQQNKRGTGSQNRGLHSSTARGSKNAMSNRGQANFSREREQHQGPPKPPSPARTIQMIISGGDEATINHVKFTTTHKLKWSITHERYDDLGDSIIFDMSDTDILTFPYFDALVITLCISDTDVRRIMVDDVSGACIIHPHILTQIRLEDKIVPRCITLTGFNNAAERTSGEMTLHVLAGGITLETTFHVINQDTAYNAIIGRPWIRAIRVILPS